MTRTPQILVAGIGNTWLRDDGFGSEVVRLLRERGEPPAGVHLADFGTSGLDLAYEAMRGYDGLILVDASRQGEQPGTLYVMEPTPTTSRARSRTASCSTRTRWTRSPCCASSSTSAAGRAAWSSSPVSPRMSPTSASACRDAVAAVLQRAADVVLRDRRRAAGASRRRRRSRACMSSRSPARCSTPPAPRGRSPRHHGLGSHGAMRQVVPRSLEFYFEIVARDTAVRGRDARLTEVATELRCRACGAAGRPRSPPSAARAAAAPT